MRIGIYMILGIGVCTSAVIKVQKDPKSLLKRYRWSGKLFKRINYNTLAAADLIGSPEWEASVQGKSKKEIQKAKQFILSRAQIADNNDQALPDEIALAKAGQSVTKMKDHLIKNTDPELLSKAKKKRLRN
ncbi:hypothetical protein BB561_002285 [Smittium simulii]|uniref:Uncharacterized protein n=1 Tax=Smittium simulii TaxID=133385 RepID=A0A2T9YR64_9FUNG|nr:hypothetical protein BB561_002285 [Smittium simulii]